MREKILAVLLVLSSLPIANVQAKSCPDVQLIFIRGSGETQNEDKNYQTFRSSIEEKLKTTRLSYDFLDLDYPAVGIGDFSVLLGAALSAGEAYTFGESVNDGVQKLISSVNNSVCKNTKFVLGGYSQGAMVISKALPSLNSDKVIYAATFGDPKIYLPEGAGFIPPACKGEGLSNYRAYVPDCLAYKGLLGAYEPYQPESFINKLGTWCNKGDIFCSHLFNVSDHVSYVKDGLYEDASRTIFYKITDYFEVENRISSPHDTAILIDSTASMESMINKYKAEAYRLAKETLDAGGRVALYDYRDLLDPYHPVKHCDFTTCDLEIFKNELDKITVADGGDERESLLSASFHVMKNLKWKQGSTKSLVILTDAGFLSPDRDGISFDDAVNLSKIIDPVNFYIITTPDNSGEYQPLADATGGKVVTDFDELNLLTDYIMARYDSLPRVEETTQPDILPTLKLGEVETMGSSSIYISFETTAPRVMVSINDMILGVTTKKELTINDLQPDAKILLVPMSDTMRGDATEIVFDVNSRTPIIPLAPDTGTPQ